MLLLAARGGLRKTVRRTDRGIDRTARLPEALRRALPRRSDASPTSPTWCVGMTTLRGTMPERRMLETTQLLGALPPDTLETLRQQASMRTVSRNEVLFRQNDAAGEMFGIVEGRIAILTASPDGRESLVAVLDEGSLFGELGLFDDGPRSADARALEETQLIVLGYEAVRAAIDEHPTMLWVIVRLLGRRLRNTDESLADAVFLDVPARTAKRLLEIAGDADQFRLPMTQEDLAGLVGASRERVNKALSLFTRLGWIEVEGRNRYRILDRKSLTDRATL